MKALVLGGCGFIGSYVVDELLQHGHSVSVFDIKPELFRSPAPQVSYHFGDFSDRMNLFEAMSGVDVVFHLISTTFPSTADLDPQLDVTGNLIASLGLLEAMIALRINRIVFLSSGGTVYGPTEIDPTPETHPLRPINSYGIVKVAIEHYLEFYRATRGLSPIAIRASNPFGPRQGHTGVQGVVSTFLRRINQSKPIEIWGDGSVVRDYIYVGDLARLCVLAAESSVTGAINAGSGIGRSINDVVAAIEECSGAPLHPIYKPGRTIDIPRSVLDVSRARELLGWTASKDFSAAMKETWAWVQSLNGSRNQPPVLR